MFQPKLTWENVAKNTLAFVTAIKNRKHLGISLAETAQDFYGENVQSSKITKEKVRNEEVAPQSCVTQLPVTKVSAPHPHLKIKRQSN